MRHSRYAVCAWLARRVLPQPEAVYSRLKIVLWGGVIGVLMPYGLKPIANQAHPLVWLLDLAVHWQWLFVLGIALCAGVLVGTRRQYALFLALLPLPMFSASPALSQSPHPAAATLTLASANVHLETADVTPFKNWLANTQPDIVAVLETSPTFANGLKQLTAYPYQILYPEYSPFGIALLSKYPITAHQLIKDAERIAHIEAEIEFNRQRIAVIAFHPMPPIAAEYHHIRDQKIQSLAHRYQDKPAIIAGDFNASPWSTAFAKLETMAWYRASGLFPTWPRWGLGIVGIPIDHVIATKAWSVLSSSVGADVGSDHFPVLVRLSLND